MILFEKPFSIKIIAIHNLFRRNSFSFLYLFTENIFKTEYKLENNSNRIIIKKNLFHQLNENKIDILIYQLNNVTEINQLNISFSKFMR